MQSKCTTKIEINKVGIEFTKKKITAYGGFSLLASFFKKIKLRDILEEVIPVKESSPNSVGIYSKLLAYILIVYAGGNRFSHLLYLGCQTVLSKLFAAGRLSLAATTLSRLFKKIRTMKELKEDFALGGFSMKHFYSTEAAMLIRVFIYNLFVLFRYKILNQKEKIQRLKTLRYKYLVMPAQLGGDGKKLILRISVFTQKLQSKLIYLYNRIQQYSPYDNANCSAFG